MFVAAQLDVSDQISGHLTGLLVARKSDFIDEVSGRFAAQKLELSRHFPAVFMATISDVCDKTSAQFAAEMLEYFPAV